MITCSTQLLRPAYVKAGEGKRPVRARTLQDLLRVAEDRGYDPQAWARRVFEARARRSPQ